MNWEAIGAIAEALGAAGVVVTLVYLASQIRANTAAVRAESRRTSVSQSVPTAAIIGSTKEAVSVFHRGILDPEALDADEQIQFGFLLSTIMAPAGNSFEPYELGIIDLASFEATSHQALALLKTPGGRHFWKRFAATHPPGFRAYVDRELAPTGLDGTPAA